MKGSQHSESWDKLPRIRIRVETSSDVTPVLVNLHSNSVVSISDVNCLFYVSIIQDKKLLLTSHF